MNGIALIMNRKIFIALLVALLALGGSLALDSLLSKGAIARAASTDNVYGWAWSDNIGWISFNSNSCDLDGDGTSDNVIAGRLPAPLASSHLQVVGDSVFLFGGTDKDGGSYGPYTNVIYRADTADPTKWIDTGKVLPSNLGNSSIIKIDPYIYLFGGSDYTVNEEGNYSGGIQDIIYRAPVSDPTNWMNMTEANSAIRLPGKLEHSSIAIIPDSNGKKYVYLFGGASIRDTFNQSSDVIYRADTTDPTFPANWVDTGKKLPPITFWREMSPRTCPKTLTQYVEHGLQKSHIAVIGKYAYLFGGTNDEYLGDSVVWFHGRSDSILRADITDPYFPGNWEDTGKKLPFTDTGTPCDGNFNGGEPGVVNSSLAVIGDYVYLFGSTFYSNIFRAPVSDPTKWVDTGARIPAWRAYSNIETIGDYVYLFGGIDNLGEGSGLKVGVEVHDYIFRAPLSDPTDWIIDGMTLPGCPLEGEPVPPYGVTINEFTGAMTGYAWSDNVGWIAFGDNDKDGRIDGRDKTASKLCKPLCEARSDNDSIDAKITGWARALSAIDADAGGWDGWISLDCKSAEDKSGFADNGCNNTSNYQVGITGGENFYGHAWGGDVIGWIEFKPANVVSAIKFGVHKKAPQNLTLTANPAVVGDGQNTQLSWFGSDSFNTCTASASQAGTGVEVGNWNEVGSEKKSPPPVSSSSVGPFTGVGNTYQLSLRCEGSGGEAYASTLVTVVAPYFSISRLSDPTVAFIGTGGAVAKTKIFATPVAGYNTDNTINLSWTVSPALPPGSTITFAPSSFTGSSAYSEGSLMTITFSKAPYPLPQDFYIKVVGSDTNNPSPDSTVTVLVKAVKVQTGFKNF